MLAFLKSGVGRTLRFLVGFLLVVAGAYFPPLIALLLIAVGSVTAVLALAGECLLESLSKREQTSSSDAHAHPAR